jgi:serine O-acetyltransferase
MAIADMTGSENSVAVTIHLHRPAPAGAGGWRGFRADLARYRAYQPDHSTLSLMLLNQGLWALLQYRVARGLHDSGMPSLLKKPLLVFCVLWQKLIEVLTGIQLPYRARIAPGLYIGHFGPIIIHPDTVIGAGCNLSQGVTLGVSGRGRCRGVPALGERVYVGANAVIAGAVYVGDDALVAANALVTRDVEPRAVMLGNPAQVVSFEGSGEYISPVCETRAASSQSL